MKRSFIYLFLILLLGFSLSCNREGGNPKGTDLVLVEHPRILLFEGEEEQIRYLIDSDEIWKKVHFTILEESNKILGKPVVKRELTGRRLLSVSRELLRRSFFLSYSFRMTNDERFLNRAEDEMLAASRFVDWNPTHFLDVAEMTTGLAIGYDWLYDDLSENAREQIKNAIINKGLLPSKDSDYNRFLRSENNWNQVCNTGMVYGALAIQEDNPELSKEIIDRAFQSIPLSMEVYGPDGVYPEGYGYWGYGTTYNVLFLSAVSKALGDDHGLASTPGFLETGHYLKHMLTPTGSSFNWSDNSMNTNIKTAMFWFAQHTNDPSVLWSEKRFLELSDFSSFKWISGFSF